MLVTAVGSKHDCSTNELVMNAQGIEELPVFVYSKDRGGKIVTEVTPRPKVGTGKGQALLSSRSFVLLRECCVEHS